MVRDLLRVLRVLWETEEWREVDLGEIVDRLVDGLGDKARDGGASLVVEALPVVWGQARKLEHALSNLLDNAVAHVPREGGVVRVDAKVDGTFVILRVRDNGCGIPAKYLGRLFQLYSRVPRSGDRGRSGVGLAIVRRVAQEHGGRVWAESEVGVGSTFYMQLPNVVAGGAQEPPTAH
jgi:signal transduction histidine kinase